MLLSGNVLMVDLKSGCCCSQIYNSLLGLRGLTISQDTKGQNCCHLAGDRCGARGDRLREDELEVHLVLVLEIPGVVVGEVGVAEFEVVEVDEVVAEVGASVPGADMELDEAVARDVKRGDRLEIGMGISARRGDGYEPVFVSEGTQALGAALVAGDGVKL